MSQQTITLHTPTSTQTLAVTRVKVIDRGSGVCDELQITLDPRVLPKVKGLEINAPVISIETNHHGGELLAKCLGLEVDESEFHGTL